MGFVIIGDQWNPCDDINSIFAFIFECAFFFNLVHKYYKLKLLRKLEVDNLSKLDSIVAFRSVVVQCT